MNTCDTCRFWLPEDANPQREREYKDLRECRVHAPAVLSLTNKYRAFPQTKRNDWCGEYQQEEKKTS